MLRQDDGRGVHFHDDGGAGNTCTSLQLRTVVHDGRVIAAFHEHLLLADGRSGRVRLAHGALLARDVHALAMDHSAQAHELVLKRQREREQAGVLFVERLGDGVQAFLL